MSALKSILGRAIVKFSSSSKNLAQKTEKVVCRPCIKVDPQKKDIKPKEDVKIKKNISKTVCKPWVSYGFDHKDEKTDKKAMKASYFYAVTLCLVWGSFFWAYNPDTRERSWAQREGFLELRRRKKACKPLINPNYVNPCKIKLPTEEELAGIEIVI